ncbi:MAG TPA: trypsin-like peptidase domain-containing protein [Bacteroidota bacterium]|nr:trypsin-like peptidase domain-containing protein [Bacteroidota bacterium]
MKSRTLVVGIIVLLPFIGGALLGYSIGQNSGPAENFSPASDGAPFENAQTAAFNPQTRDSVNDLVSVSRRNAITKTVAAASPAVVGINVIELRQFRQWSPWGDDPFFRQFFGDRVYTQQVPSLGSGFFISPDGYILTNDHVAGNAKKITVTLTNGDKYDAELIGTDLISDIALLKIDGKSLPYIKLGNSDDVIIGEWVIAFGNPFGLFDINDKPTVTVGVVSSTGMKLNTQGGRVYRGMIQTDAAINSGNSGGPLVNSVGEVIGINAVIYTPNQGSIGLGFAIPINRVKTIVAELKKSGKIERDYWTGLEVQTVDARVARYFGLDKVEGVIISDVKKGSPADRAGFKAGDIILEAGGEKIMDDATLISVIDDAKVGDVVRMKILRDRKTMELSLKLEKRST